MSKEKHKEIKNKPFVTVCSWCKEYFKQEEKWVMDSIHRSKIDLWGGAGLVSISHGICPGCLSKQKTKL